MNDGFQLSNIFILIIKMSIKLLGFYLFTFFYDTLIKSFLTRFFLFCANYCVIVTTNFSRCCGWLRFAAQPKLLFFTLGTQMFVLP